MKKYRDHYFLKAKRENYPARSVYKLKEMDKKFHLFKPGQRVLDLGAAPGSWTLYAAERIGDHGRALGVDLQTTETSFPANATFLQGDVFEPSGEVLAAMDGLAPFDLVISDMAPKTCGVKHADQARSMNLAEAALEIAVERLKPGGHFVVKIFLGPDVSELTRAMRGVFETVKSFKPDSSRSESKEQFLVGLGSKKPRAAPDSDTPPASMS